MAITSPVDSSSAYRLVTFGLGGEVSLWVHQIPDRRRDAARPDAWMMRGSVIGCADTADHGGHRHGPGAVVAGWTVAVELAGRDGGGIAPGAATHAVATVTATTTTERFTTPSWPADDGRALRDAQPRTAAAELGRW